MAIDLYGDEVLAVVPRLADLLRCGEVIRSLHIDGSQVNAGLRLDAKPIFASTSGRSSPSLTEES